MGSPPLPVELTDRIIDFCHDDKRTLSNCTLTHSSWLAASRFHLFDTITTVGVDSDTDRVNQLASVVNRTSSALPHGLSILPYIRTVKIDSLVEFDRPARLRCAAHLVDTIRQLCNREGLPAPSVHASLSMAFGRREALRQFSLVNDLVTQVRLSSISFSHPRYIWPFLSSFPRLQYLGLERVGFGDSPTSSFPAEDIFNGIPLSTIRMTTAYMGFIIASLIRVAGSLPHLEDFGIEYQDIRQAALPRLADAIQERVKCLKFSVECCPGVNRGGDPRPSASDIRIPEFVGRFRSLNTLVLGDLRVVGSGRHGGSNISFEWIPGVLQQLSSPVRKLVFEVTAMERLQLDAIPWALIDRVVDPDAPQFRELIYVEVLVKWEVIPGDRPPIGLRDGVRGDIVWRLHALDLLGLLRCDVVGC